MSTTNMPQRATTQDSSSTSTSATQHHFSSPDGASSDTYSSTITNKSPPTITTTNTKHNAHHGDGNPVNHYRAPFPSTIEILFEQPPAPPTLLFNFTHSARTFLGDMTKAHKFHISCRVPTLLFDQNPRLVAVPYPPGLMKMYYARAGNVGLEFADLQSLRAFQDGICGVGHVSVKADAGLFRCYLGNKRVEDAAGRVEDGGSHAHDGCGEVGQRRNGESRRHGVRGRRSRGVKGYGGEAGEVEACTGFAIASLDDGEGCLLNE